jgi:hypothetical protein
MRFSHYAGRISRIDPQPKEIVMTRIVLAATALLALTAAAQAADTLEARIHTAAVEACAVESSASLPASHYDAIAKSCVYRISTAAMRRMAAEATDKTMASTAALN